MSQYPIVKVGPRGFRGQRIEVDRVSYESRVTKHHGIPCIDSNNLPSGYIAGVGGGMAWDITTQRPYHSDGAKWFPIGGGAPGTVRSYSQIKDGGQTLLKNTPTILSDWDVETSPAYHTIPEWNLTTGIYTAGDREDVSIQANISWAGGVSNLGNRILRLQFFDFSTATTSTIKESITQANPDLLVDTTQDIAIHVGMDPGDRIFVEVEHTAPVSLTICGGDCTSMSGFRVQLT
ncbi:hypothetical protein DRO61_06850 [Candidatus Bathyarchaeota archaeon]|nr:MAG: hypothetical protein DRO61_06850 [Candidatus Bathyarchaeota archaeon]